MPYVGENDDKGVEKKGRMWNTKKRKERRKKKINKEITIIHAERLKIKAKGLHDLSKHRCILRRGKYIFIVVLGHPDNLQE
jgi:hypothetical protein